MGSVERRSYRNEETVILVKPQPQWVKDRELLKTAVEPKLEFVGQLGVDGVVDGLLPNGDEYTWVKRRSIPGTKYKGRKQ